MLGSYARYAIEMANERRRAAVQGRPVMPDPIGQSQAQAELDEMIARESKRIGERNSRPIGER